jgi:transcriptional regulator with XRE-family HTH domain
VRKKADELDAKIGITIRILRKNNKLTQKELGYVLNVSGTQIAKYETANHKISASSLYRLSKYFKLNMEHFVK